LQQIVLALIADPNYQEDFWHGETNW
jgi:hypothetical protein